MFTYSYGGAVLLFGVWMCECVCDMACGYVWGPVPVQTYVHVEAIPTLLFETGSVTGLEFTK